MPFDSDDTAAARVVGRRHAAQAESTVPKTAAVTTIHENIGSADVHSQRQTSTVQHDDDALSWC